MSPTLRPFLNSLPDGAPCVIFGPRRAPQHVLRWAEASGRIAIETKHPVWSGGAHGVDTAAQQGAERAGGETVIFRPDAPRDATRGEYIAALFFRSRRALEIAHVQGGGAVIFIPSTSLWSIKNQQRCPGGSEYSARVALKIRIPLFLVPFEVSPLHGPLPEVFNAPAWSRLD
jgi:hypothetical protein